MRNEIRTLRGERGLSQRQLAQAMDVSRQTINSIETERYTPSLPLSATAFAGHVLIAAVIVLWLVDVARCNDGMPYNALGAVAGLAYLAGVVWARFRR